jgi:hypothetical protein
MDEPQKVADGWHAKRHEGKVPSALVTPGDPRITRYNEYIWQLANLASALPLHLAPNRMFLSSRDFAALIAELRENHADESQHYADPTYVIYGKKPEFKVINAGTDDDVEVNRMNQETPGAMDFVARAQQFIPKVVIKANTR